MAKAELYVKNGDSWINYNLINAYPVGSIYCSALATSPATLFGGSWAEITGAVLRGNKQSGVYSDSDLCTLTTAQLPAHSHRYGSDLVYTGGNSHPCIPDSRYGGVAAWWYCWAANGSTNNTGSGEAHTNKQRSYNVYMWRRTA